MARQSSFFSSQDPIFSVATESIVASLRNAEIKFFSIKSTTLSPYSSEIKLTAQDYRYGNDGIARARLIIVSVPDVNSEDANALRSFVFDADSLSEADLSLIAESILDTGIVVCHNASFHLNWLYKYTSKEVAQVFDLMLAGMRIKPRLLVSLAEILTEPTTSKDKKAWISKLIKSERSGFNLADMLYHFCDFEVSPEFTKDKASQICCMAAIPEDFIEQSIKENQALRMLTSRLLDTAEADLKIKLESLILSDPALFTQMESVKSVLQLMRKGVPWSQQIADDFVKDKRKEMSDCFDGLLSANPDLQIFRESLMDHTKGTSSEFVAALGKTFLSLGITPTASASSGNGKTASYKIGVDELVYASLYQSKFSSEEQQRKALAFLADWCKFVHAKDCVKTSLSFSSYAQRCDGRIHPFFSHGTHSGRLSAKEPPFHSAPSNQQFRKIVHAGLGKKIASFDFNAMDMVCVAALSIRTQRIIKEFFSNQSCSIRFSQDDNIYKTTPDVLHAITEILSSCTDIHSTTLMFKAARMEEQKAVAAYREHCDSIAPTAANARSSYYEQRKKLHRMQQIATFKRCYTSIVGKCIVAGDNEWGFLRDAMRRTGMDIHTWTTIHMMNPDAVKQTANIKDEDLEAFIINERNRLGDLRRVGKIGNLQLTYRMTAKSLSSEVAKKYSLKWDVKECMSIIRDWLKVNLEVELFHIWTELNPEKWIKIPSKGQNHWETKAAYRVTTLGGRIIYSMGLPSALNHQGQGSGADIMDIFMSSLRLRRPDVFACMINQIHDEVVFEFPEQEALTYKEIVQNLLVESAMKLLSPYGLNIRVVGHLGDFWEK